jgi:hypothetical protein
MKRLASATVSLVALSACAPLQQAPLVYSSKTVVGLDISATTTETPGASFAFGYKSVDAAYVPVAVARICEPPQPCATEGFHLQQIRGDHTALNNKDEDAANLGKVPEDAMRSTWKNDAYSVFGSFDAKTKSEIASSIQKQNLTADAKVEPSLVLGKVFSTGVASQNLTEGMGRYYRAMALTHVAQVMADCVSTVSKAAEKLVSFKEGAKEMVVAALEACKAIEKLPLYPPVPAKSDDLKQVSNQPSKTADAGNSN